MIGLRFDIWLMCFFMAMLVSNSLAVEYQRETGGSLYWGYSRDPLHNPLNSAFNITDLNASQSAVITPNADPKGSDSEYFTGWGYLINGGYWLSLLWNMSLGLPNWLNVAFNVPMLWAIPIGFFINLMNFLGLIQLFGRFSEGGYI